MKGEEASVQVEKVIGLKYITGEALSEQEHLIRFYRPRRAKLMNGGRWGKSSILITN